MASHALDKERQDLAAAASVLNQTLQVVAFNVEALLFKQADLQHMLAPAVF